MAQVGATEMDNRRVSQVEGKPKMEVMGRVEVIVGPWYRKALAREKEGGESSQKRPAGGKEPAGY